MEPPNRSSLHPHVEVKAKPFLSKAACCFLLLPLTSISKLPMTVLRPSGDNHHNSVTQWNCSVFTPAEDPCSAGHWRMGLGYYTYKAPVFLMGLSGCLNPSMQLNDSLNCHLSAGQLWHCRAGMHWKFLQQRCFTSPTPMWSEVFL